MKNINLEWIENKLGDGIRLRDMNFVTGDLIVIEQINIDTSPSLKPHYYFVVERTKYEAKLFSLTSSYLERLEKENFVVFKGERWAVLSRTEPQVTNQ